MLAQFNGRQRTAKAFEKLFLQADKRFHLLDIWRPRGNAMAIIEVVWRPGPERTMVNAK